MSEGERSAEELLWTSAVNGLVRAGLVAVQGRDAEDVARDVRAYMRDWAQSGLAIEFLTDYGDTLASQASAQHDTGNHAIAVVLYATWVEHWINDMIAAAVLRRGLTQRVVKSVIRDSSLRAKLDWLWQLLYAEPLDPRVKAQIGALAEARNAFVHYKWDPLDAELEDQRRDEAFEHLSKAGPSLLESLEGLRARLLYASGPEGGVLDDAVQMLAQGPSESAEDE